MLWSFCGSFSCNSISVQPSMEWISTKKEIPTNLVKFTLIHFLSFLTHLFIASRTLQLYYVSSIRWLNIKICHWENVQWRKKFSYSEMTGCSVLHECFSRINLKMKLSCTMLCLLLAKGPKLRCFLLTIVLTHTYF